MPNYNLYICIRKDGVLFGPGTSPSAPVRLTSVDEVSQADLDAISEALVLAASDESILATKGLTKVL